LIFVMHELHTMTSLKRQLLIACLHRKNMIFAGVSNAVRDDMRKDLWCVPKDRITTLYNVIDMDMTAPKLLSRENARAALNLQAHSFVFGNIARLSPNKDQANLIRAFALIKSTCPDSQLIILGDGELEQALKE
jgi:glycosyltransferase involved in cell wall biosynthesis